MKACVDDILDTYQIIKLAFDRGENVLGKGENVVYQNVFISLLSKKFF